MTERSITNNQDLTQRGYDSASGRRQINVSQGERWASVAGGGMLALCGVRRGGGGGLLLALAGGALFYRGMTGHCDFYGALGFNSADGEGRQPGILSAEDLRVGKDVKFERGVTMKQMALTEGRVAIYF